MKNDRSKNRIDLEKHIDLIQENQKMILIRSHRYFYLDDIVKVCKSDRKKSELMKISQLGFSFLFVMESDAINLDFL